MRDFNWDLKRTFLRLQVSEPRDLMRAHYFTVATVAVAVVIVCQGLTVKAVDTHRARHRCEYKQLNKYEKMKMRTLACLRNT